MKGLKMLSINVSTYLIKSDLKIHIYGLLSIYSDLVKLPTDFLVFSSCLAWFACGIGKLLAAEFVKCLTLYSTIISVIFGFSKQNLKNVY